MNTVFNVQMLNTKFDNTSIIQRIQIHTLLAPEFIYQLFTLYKVELRLCYCDSKS